MRTLLNFNILLVDDDPDSHALVKAYLKRIENCEYRLDSVFDFHSALERLRDPAFEYDAILIDHYLGDHRGTEILRELEMAPALPPVIVFTGTEDQALDIEAMSLGASDFLVKPQMNSALLDRSIRYAIEHRKNERLILLKQREIASQLKLAALGEMASAVTHEINNPLAVIQAKAALIQTLASMDPEMHPKVRECADEIIQMIRRVGEIKTGLKRQFLRDEGCVPETVGMRALLSEAIRLSEVRRKQARVSISLAVPEDAKLPCRPTEISQVIVNLLNNAVEAVTPLEERWIRVEAESEADESEIVIQITDSGKGIFGETAGRLFESRYTTKAEGMGIGLNLSRKIIEAHGGTLGLDTTADHTRFVIRLPLRPLPMQLSPLRFLVIDDEREILELVRESLERRGFDVSLADDPLVAVALVTQETYDVVIVDLRMPKMTGLKFSEELRKSASKDAALIFISGFIEGDLRRKLEREPDLGFFEKPFDIEKLVTRAVQMSGKKNAPKAKAFGA